MVPGYCVNTHLHKARNLDVAHQSVVMFYSNNVRRNQFIVCQSRVARLCIETKLQFLEPSKTRSPRPRSLILLEIRHGLVRGLTLDYSYVGRAKGDSIIKNSHPQLFWHQEPMLL